MNEKNSEQTKSRKINKWLVALLVIFLLLGIIFVVAFSYYRNHIDVAKEYDEYFDYNLDSSNTSEYAFEDFFDYDSIHDPNNLYISIPKQYIYEKLIKLDDINKQLNQNYKVNINRIGLVSNDNDNSLIDFYVDCSYADIVNTLVYGEIEYKFTENNGLNLYINSLNIGKDLPKSIIDKYIPIENGQLIYEIKAEDYELLDSKMIKLDKINKIEVDKENLDIEYNVYEVVRQIVIDTYNEDSQEIDNLAKIMTPGIVETIIQISKITLDK